MRCSSASRSRSRFAASRRAAEAVLLAVALAGCYSTPALQPYATDGCSLFPDRALIGNADWCECCAAHDLAYWRGGTEDERAAADQALRECVTRKTGNRVLAAAMYQGVRAGGSAYFPTWYRWAYGWTYGRSYAPLDPGEQALAARLEKEYRARPPLACGVVEAPPPMP